MTISEQQYREMEARLAKGRKKPSPESQDAPPARFAGREADLHRQIEDELKRRRWYYVHSRTDRKTTQQAGVVDFIVAAPERGYGKGFVKRSTTYWIEVKVKGNKLSAEQTITKHVLQALGHKWAVVYSFEEFLQAIDT